MTDLQSLLTRLEEAEGGDRALGEDVLFATGHRFSLAFLSSTGWKWRGVSLLEREVDVTASLDAALALVERVLPGWSWGISGALKPPCDALLYEPTRGGFKQKIKASGCTPPIALLSALLRAKLSEAAALKEADRSGLGVSVAESGGMASPKSDSDGGH